MNAWRDEQREVGKCIDGWTGISGRMHCRTEIQMNRNLLRTGRDVVHSECWTMIIFIKGLLC